MSQQEDMALEEPIQEQQTQMYEFENVNDLIFQIIDKTDMVRDQSNISAAEELLNEFFNGVINETISVSGELIAAIMGCIAKIDVTINEQLNEIIHQQDFMKLESSWRGVHYLVSNTDTNSMLKLRVFNIKKDELQDDLEKAIDFDQSYFFKMLYEQEYGVFGGIPYSFVIGDYEFGRGPEDISLLEKISNVCAAALAPFISAASPELFDMKSFTELDIPRDLSKTFESNEMINWRSLVEKDDSRYIVLTLPHILMRLPYGPDTKKVKGLNFIEDVTEKDHSKYCWGNAAYALGQRITNAFSKYNWCCAIRGVEGGGLIEGLPVHTFKSINGDESYKIPTEIAITDRRELELSELGFMPVVYCKNSNKAAIFGGQTIKKPDIFDDPVAEANSRLSTVLPYVMACNRVGHFIKVMMRDKIGSFKSREEIETFLNNWVMNYVLAKDDAGHELKARYPLREARIDVVEDPSRPGCYKAVAFLRPHFQLEKLTTSIRLVTDLPAREN
jgi:type VI secretion system protein ImpC